MSGGIFETRRRWFEDALERHEGPLVRYAVGFVRDISRAQDVVQETFLQLWEKGPEELDGRVAAWLFTVCRHRALDVRRKEARMTELTEGQADACMPANANPGVGLERQETVDCVAAALDQLSSSQQEVIRLKFQEELSYRQISEITSLSVSNVGYLIHTGIKKLRGQLAE